MLVLDRKTGEFHDDWFASLPKYLRPDDCLVLNNTRVFPARLHGWRNSLGGAEVEVFLVRCQDAQEETWTALVRPGKRVRRGDRILFSPEFECEVLAQGEFGERTVRMLAKRAVRDLLEEFGSVPLPPYIHRRPEAADRERYQTVFAAERGSVAAPTAGLHFTPQMLERCQEAGASIAQVTLHVGPGTFAPVRVAEVEDIRLHAEAFAIGGEDAERMRSATRLMCVGTTSVRTVETAMARGGLRAMSGETDLFIGPGYRFAGTGAILTNFHLPESSLLMLVAAFAGRENVLAAYRHAVAARYRFFSYGDCMLIV